MCQTPSSRPKEAPDSSPALTRSPHLCCECGVTVGFSLLDIPRADSRGSTDGWVQTVLGFICEACATSRG